LKTILCYGDSITWGYIPGNLGRYPRAGRWPWMLQDRLGKEYEVIAEGLCGRYTVLDEPYRSGRNGAMLLQPILESHAPIDLLVLFLGKNDVLHFADMTAYDAARGIEVLIKMAKTSETGRTESSPEILVVSPSLIRELSDELQILCHGNPRMSLEFSRFYSEVAQRHGVHFLDAAQICEPSSSSR